MLQKQYFGQKLKDSQIERILGNYNIKYSSLQNEINYKLSILIQTFLKDIHSFLENFQEITNEVSFSYLQKETKYSRIRAN